MPNQRRRNRVTTWLAILLAVFGVVAIVLAVTFALWWWRSSEEELARHTSPNGRWVLVIGHDGPGSVRGPSRVTLFSESAETGQRKSLVRFSVANDGAILSAMACNVSWNKEGEAVALVRCQGQEQSDDVFLVNLVEADAWRLAGE